MKVFVTVGSMLPFDRLVGAMDAWAAAHPEAEVFAQIGDGGGRPAHMPWASMLTPSDFRRRCASSDVIVSHAGMGTILSAAESGRPLLCLPRRPELKEVTSAHQIATARWLRERPGIRVIDDEAGLAGAIAEALSSPGSDAARSGADPQLIDAVRGFLLEATQGPAPRIQR